MLPQAELENYKLQVELLQEKLTRSEQNRQQLEHKLDKILQKRSELDKSMRQKTRQKHLEFLDEQTKRNERNKMLVQMLERIDQQTAAMSARSERLKMMKLQYQMYFAKLMQTQTMRCCLQQTNTPTAIPVLVPTAQATVATSAAGKSTPTAMATTELSTTMPNSKLTPLSPALGGQLVPLDNTQQWTLAMATPTPAGMLLSTPTRTGAGGACMGDYLQYPIGYLPRMATGTLGCDNLYAVSGGRNVAGGGDDGSDARNLYDLRASLRAFDMNERVDLPEASPAAAAASIRKSYNNDVGIDLHKSKIYNDDDDGDGDMDNFAAICGDDATGVYQTAGKARSPHAMSVGELSSTPSTLATSSLTLDKLPKTLLSEAAATTTTPLMSDEHWKLQEEEQQQQRLRYLAGNKSDDVGKPQMAKPLNGDGISTRSNYRDNVGDDDALPNSRVTRVEQEKSSSDATADAVNNERGQVEVNFGKLKIDEPWQTTNKSWQQQQQPSTEDIFKMNMNKPEMETANNISSTAAAAAAASTLSVPNSEEQAAVRMTYTAAAAAAAAAASARTSSVDEQLNATQGNQLPSSSLSSPALNRAVEQLLTKPTMSIENIENAIYGELLNPAAATSSSLPPPPPPSPPSTTKSGVSGVPNTETVTETGHVSQGLFENLVTTQEPQIVPEPQTSVPSAATSNNITPTADYAIPSYSDEHSMSNESYEPTYATIDDTNDGQTQFNVNEPIYSEIGNPTDYQQQQQLQQGYETDAGGSAEQLPIDQKEQSQQQQQQQQHQQQVQQDDQYVNIDYSNYDVSQYDPNAYDPNAYPGYIYDEATGQYIADPSATQYATDEAYATQAYVTSGGEDGGTDYDYNAAYAQEQQQQQLQEQREIATMAEGINSYSNKANETPETQETQETTAEAAVLPENVAEMSSTGNVVPSTKVVKPISILSTTSDKQAAAAAAAASNDAQQQLQQQPKKKKRVNFVDSSETDDSSSAKPTATTSAMAQGVASVGDGESDFDFSVSSEA